MQKLDALVDHSCGWRARDVADCVEPVPEPGKPTAEASRAL